MEQRQPLGAGPVGRGHHCDLPLQDRNDFDAHWMQRRRPASLLHRSSLVSVRLTSFVMVALAGVACGSLAAEDATTKIDISKGAIGAPPADFDFQRTGQGNLGQWTLVRDANTIDGLPVEHVSTDEPEDRFALAIYRPIVAENVQVKVRLKMISGPALTAGFAVILRNPNSYYAISANAL